MHTTVLPTFRLLLSSPNSPSREQNCQQANYPIGDAHQNAIEPFKRSGRGEFEVYVGTGLKTSGACALLVYLKSILITNILFELTSIGAIAKTIAVCVVWFNNSSFGLLPELNVK